MGQRYLVPLIVEFTHLHPKVEVVLTVDDRMVDLIEEHIDIAIRVAHLEDSTLVARKLSDSTRAIVAAPSYLAGAGVPQTPADLSAHACLVYTSGQRVFDEWGFLKDGVLSLIKVRGNIQINDGMALVAAACAGGGVLVTDRMMVAHELAQGALVNLLPDYTLRPGQPIYAVYPARSGLALKTATFVAFLQERLFARQAL